MNRRERRAAQKRAPGALGEPQIAGLFAQAIRCRQLGDLEQSETICRKILESDPRHAGSLFLIGTIAMQAGRSDAAVEWYAKAAAADPRNTAFQNELGLALQARGKIDDAIASFQRVVALEPDNSRAHNNLALALQARGKLAEAASHFAKTLKLSPE